MEAVEVITIDSDSDSEDFIVSEQQAGHPANVQQPLQASSLPQQGKPSKKVSRIDI